MANSEDPRQFLWEQRVEHGRSLDTGIVEAAKILIPIIFLTMGLFPLLISLERGPFGVSVLASLAFTIYLWRGSVLLGKHKNLTDLIEGRNLRFIFWSQNALLLYLGVMFGSAAVSFFAHGFNTDVSKAILFVLPTLGVFCLGALVFRKQLALAELKAYKPLLKGQSSGYINGALVLVAVLGFGILFLSKELFGPPIGGDLRSVNYASFVLCVSGVCLAFAAYFVWRDWERLQSI